jgi:hypothetical protein
MEFLQNIRRRRHTSVRHTTNVTTKRTFVIEPEKKLEMTISQGMTPEEKSGHYHGEEDGYKIYPKHTVHFEKNSIIHQKL